MGFGASFQVSLSTIVDLLGKAKRAGFDTSIANTEEQREACVRTAHSIAGLCEWGSPLSTPTKLHTDPGGMKEKDEEDVLKSGRLPI